MADRKEIIETLRRLLPCAGSGSIPEATLRFGISMIDDHLPQEGLVPGALHEFTGTDPGDMPAAFGFATMLLGKALAKSGGSGLLVSSSKSLESFGRPHGRGLRDLGLDPARLILLETLTDRDALWAMEEALRLRAVAAVAGSIDASIDLKASRRLHLAAEGSRTLLFLLRPPDAEEANAAMTRWRIAAASAPRDRFGCFAGWRWHVDLERCRNGRPGSWIVESSSVELGHGTHPVRLVGTVAHSSLSPEAGAKPVVRRAG